MFAKFAVLCAVVALSGSVVAFPGYHHHDHDHDYYDHNPQYSFNYGVNDYSTGDHKHQSEIRANGVVKGSYSLVEPDGSIRTVDYTADDINGFNAVVSKTAPTVHKSAVVAKPVIPVAPVVEHAAPLVHAHSAPLIHKQPIYSGVQHVSSPIVQVAPAVYKQPYAATVAKTSQYTHHVPHVNHQYADYSDVYSDGYYGQYY
jgi:hypothetical protein